ncbi:AAA family ATPase [Enterococcus sp. RIT-PI-f]|uniref:AAA family ATPase n=1 Tax=Enterococcus sp. RIT-PI-f TaxID=1690244 RepID=UPI0006B8A0D7|nr:AAA family ATPase [Enterococcus sp. RIT-PI-f]KPG69751.1 ATP-binding protein [Enterococcus sp. RIT-PI-f]
MDREIRLVISGTYSTGKTTTATALSIATGIPLINALSAREILTTLYPSRRFQDMSATELMALGLKRMEERVRAESIAYGEGRSFISDGSVLNEWIYGTVRMKIGINPGAAIVHQLVKAVLGFPSRRFFRKYMTAYGQVVNLHAKEWYTDVAHLPIEFEMDSDGHRPVSERYRQLSDQHLIDSFQAIHLEPCFITGNQESRVMQIVDHYQLPLVMPIKEAVLLAELRIKENRESVSKKIIEQYSEPTVKEKIKIMTEF